MTDPTAEPSQHDRGRYVAREYHRTQVSHLRNQVAVRDAEMEQLRAERDGWKQRHADIEAGTKMKQTLIGSLRAELAEANQARADLTRVLSDGFNECRRLRAELAGLRERAVILTKRVRYVYDDTTWDGWLVTLTVAETGTQATVRRDNGEDWVVMARNIIEIPAPEPATPRKWKPGDRFTLADVNDVAAATIELTTPQACGRYEPRGELGGVVYTLCLNCGLGIAAHGSNPNGDTDA